MNLIREMMQLLNAEEPRRKYLSMKPGSLGLKSVKAASFASRNVKAS